MYCITGVDSFAVFKKSENKIPSPAIRCDFLCGFRLSSGAKVVPVSSKSDVMFWINPAQQLFALGFTAFITFFCVRIFGMVTTTISIAPMIIRMV